MPPSDPPPFRFGSGTRHHRLMGRRKYYGMKFRPHRFKSRRQVEAEERGEEFPPPFCDYPKHGVVCYY